MERLRFGLIPDEANATLADDLARAAGEYLHTDVEVHRATDYRVLASSLEQGRIDVAWVPPVGAARLVTSGVVRELALTMRNGQSTYLTGLFALRSSKIETPADLRGVRAAWVDRESASGYIVIRAALRAAGVSLVQAFSEEHFVRSHSEIASVIPYAKEKGVKIAIEVVWNEFLTTPEQLVKYVDEFKDPTVGAYFDCSNMIKYGRPSAEWIRLLGKRLLKFDFKGYSKQKGWVAIGEGDEDWPAIRAALGEIGYEGWATAEVDAGDKAHLADVKKRLDRVLSL